MNRRIQLAAMGEATTAQSVHLHIRRMVVDSDAAGGASIHPSQLIESIQASLAARLGVDGAGQDLRPLHPLATPIADAVAAHISTARGGASSRPAARNREAGHG